MSLSINRSTLIASVQPIVKPILELAAAASLVGIGYFGTQFLGKAPMFVVSGSVSTLGLAAELARTLVPKSKSTFLQVEPDEQAVEEEEEVVQPTTKKRGKQSS